eukprot:TRINITY_DN1072_c4_g1_i1.p2 TRINITY_DN1072_c4_g1~~TRINITY_DN1072_c4_g1_i1.p2  ORF type:complete len:103 (+),score=1.04 TRINITY_DN1072_c4_g1_i1:2174-2482(+)
MLARFDTPSHSGIIMLPIGVFFSFVYQLRRWMLRFSDLAETNDPVSGKLLNACLNSIFGLGFDTIVFFLPFFLFSVEKIFSPLPSPCSTDPFYGAVNPQCGE